MLAYGNPACHKGHVQTFSSKSPWMVHFERGMPWEKVGYEDCRKVYEKSAGIIEGHLKEISDLKAELETWRKLKIWFWLIIGVLIIGNLIYIFKDFLWTLIKARLGL
jgi:hypothetical protein